LDCQYVDAGEDAAHLATAGFSVRSTLIREPIPGAEFPSRRAYLMACADTP
jgi:hypothetical protein